MVGSCCYIAANGKWLSQRAIFGEYHAGLYCVTVDSMKAMYDLPNKSLINVGVGVSIKCLLPSFLFRHFHSLNVRTCFGNDIT